MKITGCIFDMDGTLLDTMPYWSIVGKDYVVSQGKTPAPDIDEKLRAMNMRQSADYFRNDYGIDRTVPEIAQGINDIMEIYYKTKARPKEGVIEFLEQMKAQGVKMCVASATDNYLIRYALKANHMEDYFCEILSCTDVGKSKEYPDIYDTALEKMGTDKETTYVFEDAYHAVKTLRANNYKIVGIHDAASADQEEIIRAAADVYVNSFKELKDIFKD